MNEHELFLEITTEDNETIYAHLTVSDNEPVMRSAEYVAGITLYDNNGCEIDGGEIDIFEDVPLEDTLDDCISFVDPFIRVESYSVIKEDRFRDIVKDF